MRALWAKLALWVLPADLDVMPRHSMPWEPWQFSSAIRCSYERLLLRR